MLNLKISIDVIPQRRPRFVNGIAIDAPQSRKFKQELAWRIKSLMRDTKILTVPLKVSIKIFRKFKRRDTRRYGDIDNLIKGIFDAMSGIVWRDDSQIVSIYAEKFLDADPHVEISIEEADNE